MTQYPDNDLDVLSIHLLLMAEIDRVEDLLDVLLRSERTETGTKYIARTHLIQAVTEISLAADQFQVE